MPSASLELQKAIVAALKADAAVSGIVGSNVFDAVPESNPFPRITLGGDQVILQRADCYLGDEIYMTIDVWSRLVGFPETKRIVAAVRDALHEADLPLSGFRLLDMAVEDERFLRDPDGLTHHGVVSLRVLTEPTA